jgi:hypothetical protein
MTHWTFSTTTLGRASVIGIACLTLTACGGRALLNDHEDYAASYADSSNAQMLMNLARRDQGHPPYFLQLASISASHQHSATLGGGGTLNSAVTKGTAGISDVLTKATSPSVSLTAGESPTFAFAPLSGSSFAGALLSPIGSDVFFGLLAQGTPANQLLRTMTQKVTFTWKSGAQLQLRNGVPDEHRFEAFRNYLRFAGVMREMQKQGVLDVTKSKEGVPNGLAFTDGMKGMFALIASDPNRYNFLESVHPSGIRGLPTVEFSFRTFDSLLTAMATEQEVFDLLASRHSKEFLEHIPDSEIQPILRTKWRGIVAPTSAPVATVNYRGTTYEVKDIIVDDPGTKWRERNRWNRDSFHLLSDMFTVISLDPKQLPAQQLIQIR